MFKVNPVFNTDAYKVSHKKFETTGTEYVQANFTPRSFRLFPMDIDQCVVFGNQRMIRKLLDIWQENFFDQPKAQVLAEVERVFSNFLGMKAEALQHFGDLYDLGLLPIKIKGLPEGSKVNAKIPVLTIENTHPDYAWLVTYLETWISTEMWLPMTSATTVYHFRKLINDWAMKTVGNTEGTEFQLHDFSYRGMGPEEAEASGAGFLLSSWGTDTIPSLLSLEYYYDADITQEPIGFSVPATEHSVTCVGIGVNGELETMRKWITEDYPTGIVSIVADTLDFFRVITDYAEQMKEDILNRKPNELGLAKTVFRPDSGDPVKILTGYTTKTIDTSVYQQILDADGFECVRDKVTGKCYLLEVTRNEGWFKNDDYKLTEISPAEAKGAVECLWDVFGGTTSDKGYKQLHERVGLIYGDSITYERAEQIMQRLADKGFASTNVVFGVGSYSMRYVTRDSLGSAVKVTWAQVDGVEYAVSKDPVTDSGVKKSARGYLDVVEKNGQFELVESEKRHDGLIGTAMKTILFDGSEIYPTNLQEIRARLWAE